MSELAILTSAPVNLSAAALAPRLPQRRAHDPLGLGGARLPAPADPDAYDRAREEAEGARALLSAAERAALDAELATHGFYSPATVRALVAENCARGQLESTGLDPEFLLILDARIDYKLFIAGDNVFVREELYASYPFHEFGVQPEAVFAAQEIGVFASMAATASMAAPDYAVRDAGDARLDFSPAEDLVRAACGGPPPRRPTRIIKTKIYVGREAWEDFKLHMRFYRGAVRMAAAGGAPLRLLGAVEPTSQVGAAITVVSVDSENALHLKVASLTQQVAALALQLEALMQRMDALAPK